MENPQAANGGISEHHKNFTVLKEKGPFAIKNISAEKPISAAKEWVKELTPETRTKFLANKSSIFQLLNINSFKEIKNLIENKELREEANKNAYILLGHTYGLEGSIEDITPRINTYIKTADHIINSLITGKGVLSKHSAELEMINEVSSTNKPVDLLLIMLNDKYSPRARFEAKRKIVLSHLTASIYQRERQIDKSDNFNRFLNFLSEDVWAKDAKIGEIKTVYALSSHDPQTQACIAPVRMITEEEKKDIKLQSNQKLTSLNVREFESNGRKIWINVKTREKEKENQVLKLLRKGEENPAIAVDDDLGLFGVLESTRNIDKFQNRLIESAARATDPKIRSSMILEEITDTIKNGNYEGKNVGSSPNLRARKFFAKMGGMRVEFILHTLESYLNYEFQHGVAHDEYEVNRLFDSGAINLLFPKDVYDMDMEKIKPQVIKQIRERQ